MSRKGIKVISILLIALMVVFSLSQFVFATETKTDYLDPTAVIGKGNGAGITSVQNVAGSIISLVQVVGISAAIIMLIVLAIKYISAAPSEKAEIKKSAVIYIVGAVILFAASAILQIIKQFSTNISVSDDTAQLIIDMAKIYLG